MLKIIALVAAILSTALALASPALAQSPAEFYRGKTLRFVTGGSSGSGYDLYARMLAPWLQQKPGATMVIESRPGAAWSKTGAASR